LVIDGAIAFTRISGASSAASERVKPYIEPLLVATCVWKLNPFCTATGEKNTTEEELPDLSNGKICCSILMPPKTCSSKSLTNASGVIRLNGRSCMLPGQYTKPSRVGGKKSNLFLE